MADIWDNLNTTKIGDDPGTVINTQTRNIHLEKSNKQLLSDVNLINQATFRDGKPIPGTQKVHASPTVTDNTRTVAFTPNEGEVWSVMNITALFTNITSSSGVYLYINDLVNSELQQFFYGSSSSTSFMLDDDSTWDDFVLSYPCQLQFMIASPTNWDDCKLQINMIRIR